MKAWSTRDLVLAGSVAVNLVLAGFVIGAGVRLVGPGAPPVEPSAFIGELSPRGLTESLDPDERRAVRQRVSREGLRSAPLFREIGQARRDFESAVRADPFDATAARDALTRLRQTELQLQTRSGDLMIDILADLPAEERARALEGLQDQRRRFRRPGGPGRVGGPGGSDAPGGPPDERSEPPPQPQPEQR